MKIVKKISWHAAAIAAAVLAAGVAQADHRDRNHRDHHSGYNSSRGGDHGRVWREHRGHHSRYYNRGYRHAPHPKIRYYHYDHYRPYRRYYRYDDGYYYGAGWPVNDFGATLTLRFPLH